MNTTDAINMIDTLRDKLIERARFANEKSQKTNYSPEIQAFLRGMRDGFSQAAQDVDKCLDQILADRAAVSGQPETRSPEDGAP